MSNKSIATIATMGIDIGKNWFHVVGLDRRGAIELRQGASEGRHAVPMALSDMRARADGAARASICVTQRDDYVKRCAERPAAVNCAPWRVPTCRGAWGRAKRSPRCLAS